eukprot:COSAG02_NODE_10198_length_1996_cov_53.011597_2_plen_112_part_00
MVHAVGALGACRGITPDYLVHAPQANTGRGAVVRHRLCATVAALFKTEQDHSHDEICDKDRDEVYQIGRRYVQVQYRGTVCGTNLIPRGRVLVVVLNTCSTALDMVQYRYY